MRFKIAFLLAVTLSAASLSAAVIGTNTPAQPLTRERIAALPSAQQPAWQEYLDRSERQMQADRAFLQNEVTAKALTNFSAPREVKGVKGIDLDHPAAWYGQPEARRIADVIVSFQTPAGGWSKNLDMTLSNRAPGEPFASGSTSLFLVPRDNNQSQDIHWSYVGTFDNDATITQLRFLAKTVAATGAESGAAYRVAFLHGLDYVFAAQFPNGGWPQIWPLEGGYHDTITINDGAMLNILALLSDVADRTNEFAFVPAETRDKAAASFQRGLECMLACQIVADGRRTVWCQQHDALTLQPASARNYEMPSQTSGESAQIVLFLMQLPQPGSNVVAAVRAAVAWFNSTKLNNVAFKADGEAGRMLVATPGNGPIWSRYYEIGTDRPIFGDRDKSIHDNVNEISRERRQGYAWFNDSPKRVLEHFRRWSLDHPAGAVTKL
jgi:PelA/Pel-15E family pectate lyase